MWTIACDLSLYRWGSCLLKTNTILSCPYISVDRFPRIAISTVGSCDRTARIEASEPTRMINPVQASIRPNRLLDPVQSVEVGLHPRDLGSYRIGLQDRGALRSHLRLRPLSLCLCARHV